jgi:hypothetical protein
MVSFMDKESNMLINKLNKEKIKLIRILLECIKGHGLNIKEGLNMIKNKDQEKHILKMEDGLVILKIINLMDMECGKELMEKYIKECGRMDI